MKANWIISLTAIAVVLWTFSLSVLAGASAVYAENPDKTRIVEAR